jgi:hypothetical protein
MQVDPFLEISREIEWHKRLIATKFNLHVKDSSGEG